MEGTSITIEDLEIHLIHIGVNGMRVTYGELIKEPMALLMEDVVEEEDNQPMHPYGGIKMYFQNIYCFLDVSGAEDIQDYVQFLQNSLLSEKFPSPYSQEDLVARTIEGQSGLVNLKQAEPDAFILEYLSASGTVVQSRQHKYFSQVRIKTGIFQQAARLALAEYQMVLGQQIIPLLENAKVDSDQLARFKAELNQLDQILEN